MDKSSAGGSDLHRFVERQMRNWELGRAQRQPRAGAGTEVMHFVAISRAIGAGGRQVGTLLGERLRWPVFDREVLHAMSGDDQYRARLYQEMDERDVSWLEQTLRWILQGEMRKDDYFYRLNETVLTIARQGHAIFLGRAADLILPKDRGFRVRVTAPLDVRVEEFAQRNNLTHSAALAEVERIDRERSEFRHRHFGRWANEPTCHDLLLNLGKLTHVQAVELILLGSRLRGVVV